MGNGQVRRLVSTVASLTVVIGALAAIGAGLCGIDRALADMPRHHSGLADPAAR